MTQFRVVKKEKKKIKRRRSLDLSSHSTHRVHESGSGPKGPILDIADDEAVRTVMYNVSVN